MSGTSERFQRKLKYKELIEKGAKISETLENNSVLENFEKIVELLNACEDITSDFVKDGKIENTSDYLMDATIIKMSHDLMGTAAEKVSENNFCEDEYVAVLLELMSSSNQNDKLLEIASRCCSTSQFQMSMYGTFSLESQSDTTQKMKVKRERAVKQKLDAKKAPENITQIVKTDKGAEKISVMIKEIERAIIERNGASLPYFEMITDPTSFMNTVDAAFQLSFLIKDGIVGLRKCENEPHVFLVDRNRTRTNNQNEESTSSVQTIMSIDPIRWKKNIQKYQLKEPLLNLHIDDSEDEYSSESSD